MSSTVELLRPLPVFADLTSEELARIGERCESTSYESNDSLRPFLALSMF
jgi:hypothetical protein